MTIYERLDKIYNVVLDKRFRERKGLGNEIGFYIFDYDADDELIVRQHIADLKKRINSGRYDIQINEFDLYEIMVEALDNKGYLEKVFDLEERKGTSAILKPIKNTLRLTQKNDLIVDRIRQQVKDHDIVFLTGIGKIWPIVRSHTVLNALHSVIDHVPVVMFYPGIYTGQGLRLFDEIPSQNYYRAFKLIER